MTVSDESNRTSAVGTGAEQIVPFTFPITDNSDIVVTSRVITTGVETLMAETTDYTVVNNGESGGSITTVTPFIANTSQIHIVRDTPNTQLLDLEQGGDFNAENVEDAFDKSTKLTIENVDALGRTLVFPATDPTSSFSDMPNSIDRASKNLTFDSDGKPTASVAVETGSVSFSAIGTNIAEAANAATVRGLVGLDTDDNVEFGDLKVTGPWVDVTHVSFGATGDGSTPDTAAIQAAIDSLPADGGVVFFPVGTYMTAKLTIPARVTLLGAQKGDPNVPANEGTVLELIALTNDSLVYSNSTGVEIRNLAFNGNKANQAVAAPLIHLDSSASNYLYDNVKIRDSKGDGIKNESSGSGRNILISGSGEEGLHQIGGDSTFVDLEINTSTNNGIKNTASNNRFIGGEIYTNGENGIESSTTLSSYTGMTVNTNDQNGILFTTGTAQASVIGCKIFANGQDATAADADQAGIHIEGSSQGVVISGNFIQVDAAQLYAVAFANCTNVAISGNYFVDTGGTATYLEVAATTNSQIFVTESNTGTPFYTAATTTRALTKTDKFLAVNSTGGSVTLTLPTVATAYPGQEYTIYQVAGTNAVIIEGAGAETVGGATNETLEGIDGYRTVKNSGGSWKIIKTSLPKGIALLSTTTVALNANGDTTIYTVPAGKTCILHSAILVAGADAGTSDISIGQNTAETDFVGVTNLDNLDAANDAVLLAPVPSATPATLKAYVATTVIQAQVANQAGGATNTLFLYGTLY